MEFDARFEANTGQEVLPIAINRGTNSPLVGTEMVHAKDDQNGH
jgi:hypothetical protein